MCRSIFTISINGETSWNIEQNWISSTVFADWFFLHRCSPDFPEWIINRAGSQLLKLSSLSLYPKFNGRLFFPFVSMLCLITFAMEHEPCADDLWGFTYVNKCWFSALSTKTGGYIPLCHDINDIIFPWQLRTSWILTPTWAEQTRGSEPWLEHTGTGSGAENTVPQNVRPNHFPYSMAIWRIYRHAISHYISLYLIFPIISHFHTHTQLNCGWFITKNLIFK